MGFQHSGSISATLPRKKPSGLLPFRLAFTKLAQLVFGFGDAYIHESIIAIRSGLVDGAHFLSAKDYRR
jgi:hypothetical protein